MKKISFLLYVILSAILSAAITVDITFNQAPGSLTVSKAPLKYNKELAYSLTLDDGYASAYKCAFPLLNSGQVSPAWNDDWGNDQGGDGYNSPGLYFTDGCGNDIPFRLGLALIGSFVQLTSPNVYITEIEALEMFDAGWDIINHDWDDQTGESGAEIDTEVNQNITYLLNLTGIRPYGFVIPSGDSSFLNHIFIHGHRFASSSAFSGSGVGAEWRIDNINTADLDDLKMVREFYMGAGASTMNANFDTTAAKADSTSQYWRHEGMHSVGNDNFWGISTEYTHFRTYMEHIEDNYGKDGDDSVWVAGKQEVYEYLSVRESAAVSCVQNSAQATVTIDTSAVSGSLRRYALTLKVEADAAIADVSVNGSTNYSYNSGSGTQLINLQWGSYQYDHFPVSSSGDTGDTGNTGSSADTGDSGSTAADPDNNNITVYPNPARRGQDIAFYDHGWTTALSVKIYSVSGKLIWSGTTEQSWNQENIFHVQVNPGVYTYTVTYPGGYSYKGKLLITE